MRGNIVGTVLLIVICSVVFIVDTFLTAYYWDLHRHFLLEYGARINVLIQRGEYWRFITPIFLHMGALHIYLNMFALLSLGVLTERMFGTWKFLLIFMMSGISGVVAGFVFADPDIPSVGASGAIFGLLGALIYFSRRRPRLFKHLTSANLYKIILINLAIGVIGYKIIDNYAHFGGFAGGMISALALGLYRENPYTRLRTGTMACWIILITGGLIAGFHK